MSTPRHAPPSPEGPPPPIVIIGAGGIVRDAHLPAYRKAGFPIAGIYNRTKSRADALADEFEIGWTTDSLSEAIDRAPDGAVFDIALMPEQYLSTLEAIPHGRAVLIQKPMGDSLADARAIRRTCNDRGLTAAINTQLRFAPYVMAVRDLIDSGRLGALYDLEVRVVVNTPWHLFPNEPK